MRIVFMGTPEFAVPTLRSLIHGGWRIEAVVTQPTGPGGGTAGEFFSIKQAAIEAGLKRVLSRRRFPEESLLSC